MSGLGSLLNVANNALLTQQINLQTTGHNVANVNSPGYSRQNVILSPRIPTPMEVGTIGNGVRAVEITRDFDRFITATLFSKSSVMSGLESRQLGMKLVEGVFNEVDENGLAELLNQFWASWDDLANNAEGGAERTTLLQRASLLVQGIRDGYQTLVKLSSDLNLNIEANIKDINQLADQIAELNVQVVSMEAGNHRANDLRDQRDQLVRQLSELTNVHYFETKRGSYTVLIGQGSPLVEGDRSWHLELRSGKVNWLGSAGQSVELTSADVPDGELGGWLDIKERITPRDTAILTGSRANTIAGDAIKPTARWGQIDGVTVNGDFTISFSGTDQDGLPIQQVFAYTAPGTPPPPNESNATVADFLNAIELAFQDNSVIPPIERVEATISDDGRIVVTDLMPGDWPISLQIDEISGNVQNLDLGMFDGSYPLNYLEQLNRFGKELIKSANLQHSQGIGLIPFQKTSGVYQAHNTDRPIGYRSSGLDFSDQVQNGAFEIWLYDAEGNVVDFDSTTPEVNEPFLVHVLAHTSSLEDIRDAINSATFAGSGVPLGLSAHIMDGRLVIQTDGSSSVAGFAFGQDTSGALLALGLNAFFVGHDGSTIGLNEALIEDQRLVAAAQVEPRGSNEATSTVALRDPDRPLGLSFQSGIFSIWVYDQNNLRVDMDETTPGQIDPIEITVDRARTSVQDILAAINDVNGLEAELDGERIRVRVTNSDWTGISFGPDSSGALAYLGVDAFEIEPIDGPQLVAREAVAGQSVALNSPASGLADYGTISPGSFNVLLYEPDGSLVAGFPRTVTVDADPTLNEIANQIGGLGGGIVGVEAQVLPDNRLVIRTTAGRSLILQNDTSGVLDALGLAQMGTDIRGIYQVDHTTDPLNDFEIGVSDRQFYVYAYDADGHVLASALTSSRVNTTGGAAIDAANQATTQWKDIDGVTLSGAFHIHFSGVNQQGQAVSGTYDGDVGGPTVRDFITAIETAFGGETVVDAFMNDSGRLTLVSQNGLPISFQIDAVTYDIATDGGLDFGTVNAAPSLSGSKANTEGGAAITEGTQWQNIDGVGPIGAFQINFTGVDQQGAIVSGAYNGIPTDTMDGFLTSIEGVFSGASEVQATIDASGRLALISQDGLPISFRIESITGATGLDFGAVGGLFTIGIDAEHDGLADVAHKFDDMPGLSTRVANGRLEIQAEEEVATFVLAGDTTGFLKAVDLFTPRGGNFAPANNLNALALRDLSRLAVEGLGDVSLNEAYQGLVGTVGIHSRGFQLDYEFSRTTVNELQARRDEVSGVSLDEEMTKLIAFQHSYTAAAKLIKAADELLMSLLQMK